jgi:hypothetical protein
MAVGLVAGCTGQSSIKPAEVLDERTGMTVGALHQPLELVQSGERSGAAGGRRMSFAYVGPVEWDNMGNLTYGLWVHLAPGADWRFDDIRTPGAVTLLLDDGTTVLSVIEAPKLGHAPYQPVASWGQTAYFGVSVPLLKQMAASRALELEVRAATGSVHFAADAEAHDSLTRYLHARGY